MPPRTIFQRNRKREEREESLAEVVGRDASRLWTRHAYHLSPDFIEALGPGAGRDVKALLAEVEEIKEKIRSRVNEKLERKLKVLGMQYFRLLKEQKDLNGLRIEQYDCSRKEYETAGRKRRQAL